MEEEETVDKRWQTDKPCPLYCHRLGNQCASSFEERPTTGWQGKDDLAEAQRDLDRERHWGVDQWDSEAEGNSGAACHSQRTSCRVESKLFGHEIFLKEALCPRIVHSCREVFFGWDGRVSEISRSKMPKKCQKMDAAMDFVLWTKWFPPQGDEYDYSIYCKCFTVKVQRPALWRVPVPLVVSIFASRGEILWRRHQTLPKPWRPCRA